MDEFMWWFIAIAVFVTLELIWRAYRKKQKRDEWIGHKIIAYGSDGYFSGRIVDFDGNTITVDKWEKDDTQ